MKILTTVKKVVDVELTMRVQDGALVEEGMQYVINAWDESAGEASVQLKENHGAETTLVSVGGGDNTDMIRRCYAMGIEKGIHIEDPALENADSWIFSRVLKKVFEAGDFDLVITGKQAQELLEEAGITINKNSVPGDPQKPTVTSGIRVGTPAITTRGMRAPEMKIIADLMVNVLKNPSSEKVIEDSRKKVRELCEAFPVYPEGGDIA